MKCQPFYLQREFMAIVVVAVNIPPCVNAKNALRELYSCNCMGQAFSQQKRWMAVYYYLCVPGLPRRPA